MFNSDKTIFTGKTKLRFLEMEHKVCRGTAGVQALTEFLGLMRYGLKHIWRADRVGQSKAGN